MTPILTVTVTAAGSGAAVTVHAVGEVDMQTAPALAEAVEAACGAAANRDRSLVVDLTGTRFFSGAGLTLLLAARRRCRDRQVRLLVVAPDSVLRPLRLTDLDGLFDLVPPTRVRQELDRAVFPPTVPRSADAG